MMAVHSTDATDSRLFPTPSLLRRLSCWFYEGVLLFGVVFIAGYLFSSLTQTRHALDNRHGLQAFVCLVLALYFTWFWHKGQTLAMKTWHIKMVDLHGHAVTQKRALLRFAWSWVWFLPPLIAGQMLNLTLASTLYTSFVWVAAWAWLARFHPQRQFWHDQWSGTRLMDVRPSLINSHANDISV